MPSRPSPARTSIRLCSIPTTISFLIERDLTVNHYEVTDLAVGTFTHASSVLSRPGPVGACPSPAASPDESHTHCWSSAEAHLRLESCAGFRCRRPAARGSSRTMTSSVRKTTRFRRWPARCGRTALVAVGLVQPHIRDLSTSTSQPGEDGSKPCSTSQRTASRLRNDHHARITSRSTSVP